jgi:phosphoribosyl-ATP pyrophosphohydrolase
LQPSDKQPGEIVLFERLRPDPETELSETFTLADLALRVKERAKASAEESYTRKLLDKGIAHCAKKLGEEAVETALAAVAEDRERLTSEAADLLYHLLVVLEARGVELAEVEAALAKRVSRSGLEEKASRSRA